MNRRESITDINNTNDLQKKYRFGTVYKTILGIGKREYFVRYFDSDDNVKAIL